MCRIKWYNDCFAKSWGTWSESKFNWKFSIARYSTRIDRDETQVFEFEPKCDRNWALRRHRFRLIPLIPEDTHLEAAVLIWKLYWNISRRPTADWLSCGRRYENHPRCFTNNLAELSNPRGTNLAWQPLCWIERLNSRSVRWSRGLSEKLYWGIQG